MRFGAVSIASSFFYIQFLSVFFGPNGINTRFSFILVKAAYNLDLVELIVSGMNNLFI